MGSLVAAIFLHEVIGLVLAAVVWGAGAGYARGRGDALDGFPAGLLAVMVGSLLFLITPWLGFVSLVLVVAPLAAVPWREAVRIPDRRWLTWAAPAVVGLPFALGLMLHGPTVNLNSAAYGDMLYYVSKLWSAVASVVPYRDLLAEGQRVITVEGGPSFIGGALSHIPGFDAILFETTSLPAFMLISVFAGFRLVARGRLPESSAWAPLLALVALASLSYPTWLPESPPAPLALPLVFVLYRVWAEETSFARVATTAGLITADLLLTKVIALVTVGVILAVLVYRRYWGLLRLTQRLAVLLAACVGAAGVVAALVLAASWYSQLFVLRFLPAEAARGLYGQLTTRDASAAAPAFQIVGQVALLVALARAHAGAIALAFATSMAATWFLGGQGFYMAVGFAIVLAVIFFWQHPAELNVQSVPLAVAAAALATWSWLQDISGLRAALVLILLLWAALMVGLTRRPPLRVLAAGLPGALLALSGYQYVAFGVTAALLVAAFVRPRFASIAVGISIALAAAATVHASVSGDFHLRDPFVALTPDDRDIWSHVHELVPRQGLVFTSMTGFSVDGRHGWDNYPAVGQRQLYLAGWYDGRLTSDHAELRLRLALNREVLNGRLAPSELPLSRHYGPYYAVLWRGERAPPSFRRIYENDRFALYRIES